MPVAVRRQPSLDLRKAARAARDAAFHYDLDSYPSPQDGAGDYYEQLSPLRKHHRGRHSLRLSMSSPALHYQYQSDEEQPSPTTAGDDAASGCSDDLPDSCSYQAGIEEEDVQGVQARSISPASSDVEAMDTSDEEVDDDEEEYEPSSFPRVLTAAALAVAVPVLAVGRPRLISVSALAPPQRRQVPIDSRPAARVAASLAIMRRFRAPAPKEIASPAQCASPTPEDDTASFSTAASSSDARTRYPASIPDRVDSLTPPEHTHAGSSPSESSSSSIVEADESVVEPAVHDASSTSEVDEQDEGELYFRDVAAATGQIKATHFHQQPFVPPPEPPRCRGPISTNASPSTRSSFIENFDASRPTTYAEYDPFALSPPTLRGNSDVMTPPESPRLRRWKGVGMSVGLGMSFGPRAVNKLKRRDSRRWGVTGFSAQGVPV